MLLRDFQSRTLWVELLVTLWHHDHPSSASPDDINIFSMCTLWHHCYRWWFLNIYIRFFKLLTFSKQHLKAGPHHIGQLSPKGHTIHSTVWCKNFYKIILSSNIGVQAPFILLHKESCNRRVHEVSNIPHRFFFFFFNKISAWSGYLECTSCWNFQSEHTTHTIYTTKWQNSA